MLRFDQFWQVGQLLIRDCTCFRGGRQERTKASVVDMCACIDQYCDDKPVVAISYLGGG